MKSLVDSCRAALLSALQHFQGTGPEGREVVGTNRFGEKALRLDRELEEVVLKAFYSQNLPFRVISEEHGIVNIVPEPKYLLTLDGIDGSYHYLHDLPLGHYGTMLSLFANLTPKYSDTVWAGVMQHKTGTLHDSLSLNAQMANVQNLSDLRYLLVDHELKDNKERIFSDLPKLDDGSNILKSWTSILLNILSNQKLAAIICTRKDCIEIPIVYKLITEAGGVMLGEDGDDLGHTSYLDHSQDLIKRTPMIIAPNRRTADLLYRRML